MTTITKGWPPARRKAQAENIRRTRPWLKTTGPRTVAGKARASRNAFKHGFRTCAFDDIKRLLRWQRTLVRQTLAHHGAGPKKLDFSLTSRGFHNINFNPEFPRFKPLRPSGWPR